MADKRHQTPDFPRREDVSESGHVSLPQPNAPEHFSGRIGSIFFIPEGAYLRIGVISGHASASASVLSVANGAMRQIKRAPLRQHVAAAGDAAQFQRHGILLLRPACGRRKNRNLPQQRSPGHPPVFGPFRSCPGTAPRNGEASGALSGPERRKKSPPAGHPPEDDHSYCQTNGERHFFHRRPPPGTRVLPAEQGLLPP